MSRKISKLDSNWEKIFKKYNIIQKIHRDGYFKITADQIKEYREPRLMTKFDHKTNLPKLFKEYELSILPITRGSYIIGKFNAYKDIEYGKDIIQKKFSLPPMINSIDTSNIYSESAALNCAFVSGVISDILGEYVLPTVSGRMSTSEFGFNVDTYGNGKFSIEVKNSQCEIDGGYEGKTKLAIIEAKNTMSNDFLIRQLYYPYRLWKNKLMDKEIIPIFMTYSDDLYSFFIYKFNNEYEYNSIELIEQRNYRISKSKITKEDILNILDKTEVENEPKIPFPQCDTFTRIMDMLTILNGRGLSSDDITEIYDFTDRQTGYYTNGARYLGLVCKDKENNKYKLTKSGQAIIGLSYKEKMLKLVEAIIKHKVFRVCLQKFLKNETLSKEYVIQVMQSSPIYNINKQSSTINRRAITVLRWCEWIYNLIDK